MWANIHFHSGSALDMPHIMSWHVMFSPIRFLRCHFCSATGCCALVFYPRSQTQGWHGPILLRENIYEKNVISGGGPAGYEKNVISGEGPAGYEKNVISGGGPAGYEKNVISGEGPAGYEKNVISGGGPAGYEKHVISAGGPAGYEKNVISGGRSAGYGTWGGPGRHKKNMLGLRTRVQSAEK